MPRERRASKLKPGPFEDCPIPKTELEKQQNGAERWLKKNVPAKLWEEMETMWNEQNLRYRAQPATINKHNGLREQKSLMKLMSYWGAVTVPRWAIKWTDAEDDGMADLGNWNYSRVFKRIWPGSHIAAYNDLTVGDHVEAFLGWHYSLVRLYEAEFDERATDIIRFLEQACFAQWAIVFFYP